MRIKVYGCSTSRDICAVLAGLYYLFVIGIDRSDKRPVGILRCTGISLPSNKYNVYGITAGRLDITYLNLCLMAAAKNDKLA